MFVSSIWFSVSCTFFTLSSDDMVGYRPTLVSRPHLTQHLASHGLTPMNARQAWSSSKPSASLCISLLAFLGSLFFVWCGFGFLLCIPCIDFCPCCGFPNWIAVLVCFPLFCFYLLFAPDPNHWTVSLRINLLALGKFLSSRLKGAILRWRGCIF